MEKYGRLTVVERLQGKPRQVRVTCECGAQKVVSAYNLERGYTKSCGCLKVDKAREMCVSRNTRHSMSHRPEYRCWKHIKARCLNPNSKDYKLYGGRGMTICEQWKDSFQAFYADMGQRPGKGFSVERRDSNKGYNPENCYWATANVQSNNTSRNRRLSVFGGEFTMAQAAREFSTPYSTLRSRVAAGWSDEAAVTTPVEDLGVGKLYELDGVSRTLTEWSRWSGVKLTTLTYRLRAGKSLREALTPGRLRSPPRC